MREKGQFVGNRQNEKGAALITVMMITVLLGIACISLLFSIAANSKNTTDTLSETKAYYAAESGMQATLNVLRGHVTPNPLIDNSKPATDPANQISYTNASTASISNYVNDLSPNVRLSRWLGYNYTPTGGTYPDRVVIGDPSTYQPNQGAAYSITIDDPDDTRSTTVFSTIAFLNNTTNNYRDFVTDANNWTRISFNGLQSNLSHPATDPGTAAAVLGNFRVEVHGNGGTITDTDFEIDYHLISPRPAVRAIRGKIVASTNKIKFQSANYSLMGQTIDLTGLDGSLQLSLNYTNNPGFNGYTPINANVNPAEPYRLVLRSTGYGPNGSRKQLEAVIARNLFNDVSSAAAVSMIGPNAGFTWDPGTSNNVSYSGVDPYETGVSVPSIGLTNQASLDYVNNHQPPTPLNPPAANISNELPDWQQSPAALDAVIQSYQTAARDTCCYYANGNSVSTVGSVSGTPPIGSGLTYVNGDFQFTGNGGGVLIVTGKLTLHGNFSFTGLIIVTGSAGVERNGGGNGTITGNMVIAPYNPSNLAAGFLPPKYQITGGGISHIVYSGSTTTSFLGTSAVSDFIQGVAEK